MTDYPTSLFEFFLMFPNEDACAQYYYDLRWPDGFRCTNPECNHDEAWKLETKPWTFECKKCHRQTSLKSQTIMHGSKLSFTKWLLATWLMTSHSNGMSALQLQKQLGLGSYKTAWLLEAKLRRAMVDPDRKPLNGLVEADESSIPFHRKTEPQTGGQGRSHQGKMLIAGACEAIRAPEIYKNKKWITGRIRISKINGYGAVDLHPFIEQNIEPGSTGKTDGHKPYASAPNIKHEPHVIGDGLAHEILQLVHLMFANLKEWAKGTYHGLRPRHLQSYLDEYVFRSNRRHNRPSGFRTLLRIATGCDPVTYKMLIAPEAGG
ncbi:MAG TPA: IS1595 family transposase [Armatimonadetes bacterium]|nr:IS1595 family transposase [Armatimonadota bacterium]